MYNYLRLLTMLFLFSGFALKAQVTVKGKVTETNGGAIVGATVLEKGTNNGVVTDIDGNYQLKVQPGSTLKISFLGYVTEEEPVNGRSIINVTLVEDIETLGEVVVTALGFKADKDEVGYANSQVDNETIVKASEANLLNSLSGKATGLNISRNSGDPGAGAFMRIRGASTLQGSGQPLIVVDGVPINNDNVGTGQIAQQSRLNDINPNDIASVSVLKGAAAAALWGTEALNGAIIITTKSGKYNQELKVSLKSTYSIDQINRRYPIQSRFGQGSDGVWNATDRSSWGDKISDRTGGADEFDTNGEFFVDQNGEIYYPITTKNSQETFVDENFDQVFQTGHFLENNLSISSGNENGHIFFSLSNLAQEGIIKNNSDYDRTTVRLNTEKALNDALTLNVNSNYTNTKSNRIRRGAQSSGLYLGLLRTAPDFNNASYRGSYYANPDASPLLNRHRSYRNPLGSGNAGYNNPLWTINEQQDLAVVDRFINNAKLTYAPTSWLEFIARVGYDTYTEEKTQFFTPGSAAGGFRSGLFEKELRTAGIFNTDLIAKGTFNINSDINVNLLIGTNYNQRKTQVNRNEIINFIQFADVASGIRDIDNAAPENRTADVFNIERRKAAVYSELTLSAFDQLYITSTIRGERSSTFGPQVDPVFWFPSVSAAWQFTKELIKTDWLSFGKLRVSYGEVGREPGAYATNNTIVQPTYGDGLGGSLSTGLYGNGGFTTSVNQGNEFLGPERKKEYEIGTDLRFLDDRISLSATYYNNTTDDLIIPLTIANTRGYDEIVANAATIQNEGVEIDLGYQLFKNDDWDISTNLIYFQNDNLVTDLEGVESFDLGGLSAVSSRVIEGEQFGVLFGSRTMRDDAGNIMFDQNGFPLQDTEEGVIGNPNPDWKGSFISNIRYKNIELSLLFETHQGADIYAGTKSVLYDLGTWGASATETTTTQNLLDYDGNVVPSGTTFRGVVKDFGAGPVALTESWYRGPGGFFGGGNDELYIEDGSWTRLRRVQLAYNLRNDWLKSKGLNSVRLSATGRNLLLWTKFEGNDPDTNLSGVSQAQGIDYFNNPGTKSYIFSVELNF